MHWIPFARHSGNAQSAGTLQNLDMGNLMVLENAQVYGFSEPEKELLHAASGDRLQAAKIGSRFRELKKFSREMIAGCHLVFLHVAEFLEGVENSMHCSACKRQGARQIRKRDRSLCASAVY